MSLKLNKYGILIIAAVLLVAVAFAGVASADDSGSYTNQTWNDIASGSMLTAGTYTITGPGIIDPKASISIDTGIVILDFSGFTGGFAGISGGIGGDNKGGLFGSVNIGSNTLEIVGLNMTSVNVASNGDYIGGIVGNVEGSGTLNFTDCHLVNCSVTGGSIHVGGLVGRAYSANVNVKDCSAKHCDVVAPNQNVGGLVGSANSASFVRGNVTNSTVASTGDGHVGGLVGHAESSASFESCGDENASVYASSYNVGGLVGYAGSASGIEGCMMKNCVIASGSYDVGGLVGGANSASGIGNCTVKNCTIKGSNYVGGLVGLAISAGGSKTNDVLYSAIKGTDVFGKNCGDIGNQSTGSTTTSDVVLSQASYPDYTDAIGLDFWKIVRWGGNGTNPSYNMFTNLSIYGKVGGYGVNSAQLYKVTYNGNGNTSGDVPVDVNGHLANSLAPVLENTGNLAKTGYVFNGWNTVADGSGTSYQPGATFTITKDTMLYAKWTELPAYVEVGTWADLVSNVTEWTSKDKMRTIVLTNESKGAYTNTTGTVGEYRGIPITGNITIKPAENKAITIDANQMGGIFYVETNADLTLKGNTSALLTLTGANDEGAINVDACGNLTLSDGVTITGCNGSKCGGVAVNGGTFTMKGGSITNCSGLIGGVFVLGNKFIMTGGNITNCIGLAGGEVEAGGVLVCGTFNVSGTATITGNSVNGVANNIYLYTTDTLNLVGPFTGTMGISNVSGSSAPTVGAKFGNYVSDNTADAKNFVSDVPGYCGNVSGSDLVWAVINTTVTPTSGVAEFSGTNTTTLENNDKVSVIILENVSNVDNAIPVIFNASSSITTELPALSGYTKDEDVTIFEITATTTGTSTINLTVTFKDAATATANKGKIHIFHYTSGAWQQLTSSILAENGNKVTYKVVTNGFSPFGVGIYTPITYTSSSSSKHSGSTVILSEGQVAPTAYATAAPTVSPTVKPTEQPAIPTAIATAKPTTTPKTPAPFVGLLAGLGAAAVLLRLRK